MSSSKTLMLMTGFTRCASCHFDQEVARYLLTGRSVNVPPLKVAPRAWYPPRGWGGSLSDGRRDVVMLSTNPGHPFIDESEVWSGMPSSPSKAKDATSEQARAQFDFVTSFYAARPSAFHTQTVKLARAILWLVEQADGGRASEAAWLDRVWFSDVVKCSTAKELGSRGIEQLAQRCSGHLRAELEHFKPRVVVTVGVGARDALTLSGVKTETTVAAPHPGSRDRRFRWWRIDDPRWDAPVFQPLAARLGLRWSVVGEGFLTVRRRLQRRPKAPLILGA